MIGIVRRPPTHRAYRPSQHSARENVLRFLSTELRVGQRSCHDCVRAWWTGDDEGEIFVVIRCSNQHAIFRYRFDGCDRDGMVRLRAHAKHKQKQQIVCLVKALRRLSRGRTCYGAAVPSDNHIPRACSRSTVRRDHGPPSRPRPDTAERSPSTAIATILAQRMAYTRSESDIRPQG